MKKLQRAFKTEIKLTQSQINKLVQSISICRWLYNSYIAKNKELYELYKEKKIDKKQSFMSANDFDKYINNEIKCQDEFKWIDNCGSKARKKSIVNAEVAFKRFFKGLSKFPRFKKKKNQDVKAYFPKNNKTDWTIERHRVKIPTIGWVKLKEFGYIPTNANVKSGTVSMKAGRFYVSVLCEVEENKNKNKSSSEGIGIDLGVKEFAYCSNGKSYKNINKTVKVRKIEKKLKREQRSLSRKYENLKKRSEKSATKKRANIDKNILRLQKLHVRLKNIREEYVKSIVSELVKTKPSYITIENLNVKGMMKNRHLSKAIAQQCFHTFKIWLVAKCREYGIQLREVDRFYPSSKICSCCGQLKGDLKLSDRVYECNCGNVMDRDLNAAINLLQAREYTILT